MAGQIRKGFFFYFGLFVLLLVAVFLVCVVVMIFNPGKTVLWLQYFSADETSHIVTTTDTGSEINFASLTDVEINCSYANVIVERDNNDKLPKDQICIVNNAKGFTAASNARDFEVSVSKEGTKLFVSVTEPNGFLFFSKNIQIILHASSLDNKPTNFDNVNLVVKTTEGNVNLGGTFLTNSSSPLTRLGSAWVQTEEGNISISNNLDTTSLKELRLSTVSGDMGSSYVTNQVNENGNKMKGLELACDATFSTKKGDVNFDALNVAGKVQLSCESGTVVNNYLNAASGTNFVSSSHGNYVFGDVVGNLDFVPSMETLGSPNIMIDSLVGNFVLGTTENGGSNPDVEIGEIVGNLTVYSENGKVNVGKISGSIEIIGSGLSTSVGVSETNSNPISVKSKGGSVKLAFKGIVSNNVLLQTEGGKVTIDVPKAANFQASFWKNNNAAEREVLTSGITLNIGEHTLNDTNPRLVIDHGNGSLGNIEIVTNGAVEINSVA